MYERMFVILVPPLRRVVLNCVQFAFLGWYVERKRTFRLEHNPDYSRCAMVLNVQILGIIAAT